jgi:hypothetical protein
LKLIGERASETTRSKEDAWNLLLERTYLRGLFFAWILDCHLRVLLFARFDLRKIFRSPAQENTQKKQQTIQLLRGFLPLNFPWPYCLRGFSLAINF